MNFNPNFKSPIKTKSLDTPTIDEGQTLDEILNKFADSGCMLHSLQEKAVKKAKQALLQWVLDVIGEDEDKFADVPDYAMMKPVYHVRNTLRAEQRAKLKSIEESK